MSKLWGILITAVVYYLHPEAAQPTASIENHFFLVYNDEEEIAVRKAKLMLIDVVQKEKGINHTIATITSVAFPEIHKEDL
jgi:hypothetical protein